jgi:hypothetical protein
MSYHEVVKPLGDPEIQYQGNIVQVVHQAMKKGDKHKVFEYADRAPGVRVLIIDKT